MYGFGLARARKSALLQNLASLRHAASFRLYSDSVASFCRPPHPFGAFSITLDSKMRDSLRRVLQRIAGCALLAHDRRFGIP